MDELGLYRSALAWTWAATAPFLIAGALTTIIGTGTPIGSILAIIGAVLMPVAAVKTNRARRGY